MSDWEALADQAQEEAYRVVETPKRTPAQKMRDLINELEKEKCAT